MADPLLLLDTHVWIWLLTGDKKLASSKCLPHINEAAKHSAIKVSAISVWEVGMLESKGRIKFSMDCLRWVQQALEAPGTSLAPMTPEIAVESCRLPGNFHGDPADRIIIATARILGACLVTDDKKILAYGKKHSLKTLTV
ncbi:MAG: type II toxin-antitoxin system VapC family toxin [Nitrospinales bacterium]